MPSDASSLTSISASQQLARLIDGYLITQLLYVAAKLGIADELVDGPRSAEDLAAAVGAHADVLRRVLRGLAAEGVVEELPGGRFGLTLVGACLRASAPGSQRGAAIARGDLYYPAVGELLETVRSGGVPFERAYGSSLFEHLTARPELGAAFQASMADRARQEAADVVAAYDFGGLRRIVDVGGGNGLLLTEILANAPNARGVLFDLPDVVARAQTRLAEADPSVTDRIELAGGDFFVSVTPGGDAYVLSRVIHDWSDTDAVRILSTVRAAMPETAKLLLVEAALPDRAQAAPGAIRMDLHMLVLLGGRERTASEYEALLASAGFRMTQVVPTDSPVGLAVIEAAPAAALA